MFNKVDYESMGHVNCLIQLRAPQFIPERGGLNPIILYIVTGHIIKKINAMILRIQ